MAGLTYGPRIIILSRGLPHAHLTKLLQSGRRIPSLTTLFRLDMYVAYVKNNPEPAPRRIKARIFRTKIRSKQKCEFVWYHRLQLGTLNNNSKILVY